MGKTRSGITKGTKITVIVLSILGIVCLVVGGAVFGVFPSMFRKKVVEGLVLGNGTESTERFISPPVAYNVYYHLFNVTNMEEVNNGTADKPILEEIGPIVYKQIKTKEQLVWNETEGKVTYRERTVYYFDEELSKYKESDVINHVNVPDITLMATMLGIFIPSLSLPPGVIGPLVVTHTASELLFSQYRINFLDWLKENNALLYSIVQKDPNFPEDHSFAFFKGKNNTLSSEFTIFTGQKGIDQYSHIAAYNNEEKLDYWENGTNCNDINGTDGAQLPPNVNYDTIYVFSSEICRSMMLQYEKDIVLKKINARRFVVPPIVFADPNTDESNQCFCKAKKFCPNAGVIPLEPCRNAPIAMSAPHFYLGDPKYVDAFGGLKPDKTEHETFLDVEPFTGTVIRGAKRLQINVITKNNSKTITQQYAKENGIFPALWLQEGAEIDQPNAERFLKQVLNPKKTVEWALIAVMAIGAVVILLGVVFYFMKR